MDDRPAFYAPRDANRLRPGDVVRGYREVQGLVVNELTVRSVARPRPGIVSVTYVGFPEPVTYSATYTVYVWRPNEVAPPPQGGAS